MSNENPHRNKIPTLTVSKTRKISLICMQTEQPLDNKYINGMWNKWNANSQKIYGRTTKKMILVISSQQKFFFVVILSITHWLYAVRGINTYLYFIHPFSYWTDGKTKISFHQKMHKFCKVPIETINSFKLGTTQQCTFFIWEERKKTNKKQFLMHLLIIDDKTPSAIML